ncbi:MAG: DUF3426 domain-containing protein [Halopseudomonas sp.]
MRQQFITQCPACKTRFDISREQLRAADGRVRCSHCQQVFVATDHLESRSAAATPLAEGAIPREPVMLSPRQRDSTPAQLGWSLLILLALSGIGLQTLWFERDQLSQHPMLLQLYSQACQKLDCQLAPRQDLPSINSQQLLIRQHPDYANAVTLDLVLINQAPFDQPFPALQLSFTGLDESLRAARIFQPKEYLGGDLQPGDLMPSRSPIQVHLELLDPGTLAPNYQLQFLRAKPHFLSNN